jgi:hypothetical protein
MLSEWMKCSLIWLTSIATTLIEALSNGGMGSPINPPTGRRRYTSSGGEHKPLHSGLSEMFWRGGATPGSMPERRWLICGVRISISGEHTWHREKVAEDTRYWFSRTSGQPWLRNEHHHITWGTSLSGTSPVIDPIPLIHWVPNDQACIGRLHFCVPPLTP